MAENSRKFHLNIFFLRILNDEMILKFDKCKKEKFFLFQPPNIPKKSSSEIIFTPSLVAFSSLAGPILSPANT